MKLIELTDYFTGTMKEYVNAENIDRIQPIVERNRSFPLFGKIETKCTGSEVYTKGVRYSTYVKETPDQIAKLIENKEQ